MVIAILYKLREIPVYSPDSLPARFTDWVLGLVKDDPTAARYAGGNILPPPGFRVTECRITPYASMLADEPDGVDIEVRIKAVYAERLKS